ncbi:MAG: DUF2784 family protein [Prolixibacteraceae bacterium]|nr:DUF2784 family protein [Prolixibacteraceae bacterium]
MYKFLDIFFVVFHLLVIFFNLFGWIFKPFWKWNLGLLVLTGLSWSVLGIFYGFGYCPLTDWHWDVLGKLGRYPTETSYTQYLFTRISGMTLKSSLADLITLISFLCALIISTISNIVEFKRRKNRVEKYKSEITSI